MNWEVVLALAVGMDLLFGEPREMLHPVVWIGKLTGAVRTRLGKSKLSGCVLALAITGVAALGGYLCTLMHGVIGMLVSAYVLKSTFSITCLADTANMMGTHLENDDLGAARKGLPMLVGRDTERLTKKEASSAVIESVAENFVDGIISPLFYFVLFGLPGALAYKAINTLDSMVGYEHEGEAGYASARLDDIANYIPARLSVLFISAGAALYGSPRSALRTSRRDHGRTASPNAGWPMSAMAGALGTSLKKPGHYVLGKGFNLPGSHHVKKAIHIVEIGTTFVVAASFATIHFMDLPLVGG